MQKLIRYIKYRNNTNQYMECFDHAKCEFGKLKVKSVANDPLKKKLEADSLNLTNEFMLYLGDKSVLRSKHMLLMCFVCDLFKCHIISCLIDFLCMQMDGKIHICSFWFAYCKIPVVSKKEAHWPYVFLSKWQEKRK